MKRTDWKRLTLKRYDKIVMGLFGLLLGLSFTACEPDEPVVEYGVQPMYGVVPTAVVDQQKPA